MTDDLNYEDYNQLYPYQTPRAYHFFKVKFTVYNKVTDEYNSMYFYVSAKRSQSWLEQQIPGNFHYPLPRNYFEYSYQIREVEDNPRIMFHHITTKEKWEWCATQYFLTVCATKRWKISIVKKIEKKLKKIYTFLVERLFINVTIIKA